MADDQDAALASQSLLTQVRSHLQMHHCQRPTDCIFSNGPDGGVMPDSFTAILTEAFVIHLQALVHISMWF